MPKKRPVPTRSSAPEDIEEAAKRFGDAAEAPVNAPALDPNAKRNFKSVNVPFNEYESDLLQRARAKESRTALSFIRNAWISHAKEILGED